MRRWMSPLIVLLIVATGPAAADQRDVRLDELFDRLSTAGDAREPALIEVTIWEIWRVYTGDDYDVTEFLNRGLRAIRRTEYRSAEILFGGAPKRSPMSLHSPKFTPDPGTVGPLADRRLRRPATVRRDTAAKVIDFGLPPRTKSA